MKKGVCKHRLGLTVGLFSFLLHAVWAGAVGFGVGQKFINWIFPLHFIDIAYSVLPFSAGSALLLVFWAFVVGYFMGWVLGWLWELTQNW